jgi:hypothetical protein
MQHLHPLKVTLPDCSLYAVERKNPLSGVAEVVVSTQESRAICNDPFVLGIDYTRKLTIAGTKALRGLQQVELFNGNEHSTHVLTILRGGLNFGLREALADAFLWNRHGAWFISAQRRLSDPNTGEWEIIEDAYAKIYPQGAMDVVFGDVVATGTSLKHGLLKLEQEHKPSVTYRSVTFFTIGAAVSGEILAEWKERIEKAQGSPVHCTVVYFEGVFGVAGPETPITIKIDGTDLLRRDGAIAPEFITSQYENTAFPLERCTIYDAGSRAFHVPEYIEDVIDYWTKVKALASDGVTYEQLVAERCPEVDISRLSAVELGDLADKQLKGLHRLIEG